MAEKQPEQHPEMAPDPDEDDLSDLDDMLDDFSTTSIKDKKQSAPSTTATTATTAAAPLPPTSSTSNPDPQPTAQDEDEFARQLQAGMAELLGGLGDDPDMQKQFADMMKELGAAAAAEQETTSAAGTAVNPTNPAPPPPTSSSTSSPSATAKPAFASTIEKTMNRMQASGQSASAAAATSSEDDMLAQMLKELEAGNFPNMDGQGGGGGDFNQMLMGMMEQLVNKDILYEPMKELEENFPDWLAKNKESTPKEDLDRYITQQAVVKDIVQRFEKKDFSDDNKEDREYIVDKMQEMQAAGQPPPGLLGDMSTAQDMMSEADACPQQ